METSVRAFLNRLQAQAHYSEHTILGYQNDLQHFINYLYQHLRRQPEIGDFNYAQVSFYLKTEQQTRQPSTVRRRLAALKRFAQYLDENRDIEAFGLPSLDQILPPAEDSFVAQRVSWLSQAQVATLMSIVQADLRPQARRDQAILTLLLEVGLSASRLVALDLVDFDRQKNLLQLLKQTGENWWLPLKESGSTLNQYLLEGRPELNPTSGENALFISQMGVRVSRQGVWQICQRWGTRANLLDGLSPRILRYTAVQRMIRAGYSEKTIQGILEHHSLAATQGMLRRIFATR